MHTANTFKTEEPGTGADTYQRIARVIRYCQAHQPSQPDLDTLAAEAGLSRFHFQRLFSQWAGVSPQQYLAYLTREKAKALLRGASQPGTVLEAALDAGLSGSGRLHDLMIRHQAVTPGQWQKQGCDLDITWGRYDSPFGTALLAITDRGVCKLGFADNGSDFATLSQELADEWPNATLQRNDQAVRPTGDQAFAGATGNTTNQPLHLLLKGTPFQLQVWEALLAIPAGQLASYQQVADAIGQPRATRAVASAIARNHIGYLIPCHRVIRGTGEMGQYRWDATRKQAMICREASTTASSEPGL